MNATRAVVEVLECRELFARPAALLIVPGLLGSLPKNAGVGDYVSYFTGKAFAPDKLGPETFENSYKKLIADAKKKAGMVEGKTLFFAAYDSRLSIAPTDGKNDGNLDLSGVKFDDKHFQYGVQYLQYWIDKARAGWVAKYGDAGEFRVDIIAHSLGGILARAFVQSSYYQKHDAGVIENVVLEGTPSKGSVDTYLVSSLTVGDYLKQQGGLFAELGSLANRFSIGKQKIGKYVPSLNDLQPAFHFTGLKAPGNPLLADLNANVSDFTSRVAGVDCVVGTAIPTAAFVKSVKPIKLATADGDSLVLATSAFIDGLGVKHVFAGIDHGALPSNAAVESAVFSYLGK